MGSLLINDITLRDGEQAPGVNFFPEEKLQIAEQLTKMKIPVIEAGFAIASASDFKAIKLIASELGTKEGPVICAMARASTRDIERAAESVLAAAKGRVQVVLATSDIHLKYKLKKTRAEIKDMTHGMVAYAGSLCADVEFAAEDATRSDLQFLIDIFKTAADAGAKTLEIPDTTGYAMPDEYAEIVKALKKNVPDDIVIATHCHNDLGLAVANTLAGIKAGARQAELTVNGIGERAGNASLEEVIMAIKTRPNYYDVDLDVDTTQIINTSRLVAELSNIEMASNKAIVGRNAFLHESGVHQHGILCNKATYQIMEPRDIGLESYGLIMGKLSGKHALKQKAVELGYDLEDGQFQKVYEQFKEMASKKKQITTEDIINLVKRYSG